MKKTFKTNKGTIKYGRPKAPSSLQRAVAILDKNRNRYMRISRRSSSEKQNTL